LVRKLKVRNYGEVVVEYEGRNEHISQLKEQTLTNTLQRLLRQGERRILFVSGHGERKPTGRANFDWNNFTEKLKVKGITTELLKLNETPNIPDVAAIIIASPQTDFLAGEVKLIIEYVKRGGNLIWVREPGTSLFGLNSLADLLGINFHPGTIVDPTAQMMNVNDPSFALITSYPSHAITRDFQYMSIFPKAVGIIHNEVKEDWLATPFLQTVPRSWSETGILKGAVDYNADEDIVGPLTIGLALTRKNNKEKKKQRIIILGDGDFLSNTYLGNQGNLNIGHNIINWISNDDDFILIPSSSAVDSQINISDLAGAIIGLFFLIILPLGLLVSGTLIWYNMSKRNLLNLILLIFILVLLAFVIYEPGNEKPITPPTLTNLTADDVEHIKIERLDNKNTIELKKINNNWMMLKPYQLPANSFRIDSINKLLSTVSFSQNNLNNLNPSEFGLNQPVATITFNHKTSIVFGHNKSLKHHRYVKIDSALHMIADTFYYQLAAKAESFISHKLLPQNSKIIKLKLPTLSLTKKEEKWIVTPKASTVSADAFNTIIDEWQLSQAYDIKVRTPSAKDKADITIYLENKNRIRFKIINNKDNFTLKDIDTGVSYILSSDRKDKLLRLSDINQDD